MVPYGQVWRTGANAATAFVTTTNLSVGGTLVPEGSYTIFTIPNLDHWTLIVSKKFGEWGTQYPGPASDLARIDMQVSPLLNQVESFTIALDQSGSSCTMRIEWERLALTYRFR